MVKYNPTIKFKRPLKNLKGKPIMLEVHKTERLTHIWVKNVAPPSTTVAIIVLLVAILNYISLTFNLTNIYVVVIVFAVSVLYCYSTLNAVVEESIMLIDSVGCQIETKYMLGKKSRFLPYENVRRIFINEVIIENKVIYVMEILAKDEKSEYLIPLFIDTLPRLQCLKQIYKYCHTFR